MALIDVTHINQLMRHGDPYSWVAMFGVSGLAAAQLEEVGTMLLERLVDWIDGSMALMALGNRRTRPPFEQRDQQSYFKCLRSPDGGRSVV